MKDTEAKKTITFVLVAGMALLVAWEPWRPAPLETSVPTAVGQKLFPDFTDPLAAKSLEIVEFNEDTASIRDFKVAQTDGVWSIPSHSNYPADAQQHMAEAATALMDLKILNLASDRPGDQKEYGVITPDPAKLRVGMTGVGRRVTVKDGADKVLADLVIGKEVKDQPALHYVRRADRDQIYTVNVRTGELSTKFDDWIEKDLLKLNTFDVREVQLNDYSSKIELSPQGWVLNKDDRNVIKLSYDDSAGKWNLDELTEFDEKRQPVAAKLAENEELDTQKLNDMKNALDDLQIVDVQRKPKGLSEDLRASEEFLNNAEAMQSLIDHGFVPVPLKPDTPPEIFSTEGEVTCTTKDGVRYVLRFGNLAGTSMEGEDPEGTPGEEPKSSAPNRYLFVMAQFDESQIKKPELKPVPGAPAADGATQDAKSGEEPAAEAAEEKPADKPAAEPADKPAEKPADAGVPETKTAFQDTQAQAPEENKPAAADEPKAAGDQAEPAKEQEAAKQPEKPADPSEEEKLAVERENKRLQEEYDNAIKSGQEKVTELNDRFADWYFIISDDVYKKVRLGLDDIVKKKDDDTSGTQDLNELEDAINIGPAKDAPK